MPRHHGRPACRRSRRRYWRRRQRLPGRWMALRRRPAPPTTGPPPRRRRRTTGRRRPPQPPRQRKYYSSGAPAVGTTSARHPGDRLILQLRLRLPPPVRPSWLNERFRSGVLRRGEGLATAAPDAERCGAGCAAARGRPMRSSLRARKSISNSFWYFFSQTTVFINS